ncbi:CoA-acylating methylmalonate-semialdehyde dehydrogenase [Oscillochloris sp. ZM17-4]|uniref:CoA-acylating methylmalonate-semialdehyde dehydrogenase n=1 Tax=Oscillochloris sp. ZM17-4 TaxID=2866714 RepID=UPI001C72B4E4|nr:CoA-acylating methylmalonate-semialdehyde dehydrogenase [Oscillochloris sp. ZM17-4]MBX0330262.1 CoA-acylating methylmalonate-semialdehyde dehydrogenase [Oscillochloris sp. ZM17-4]
MTAIVRLNNYIAGAWRAADAEALPVVNPATAETLAEVPLSPAAEVAAAAEAAMTALRAWRRVPAGDRIQPLFKLKALIEANIDDIARTITEECGKTLAESRAEIQRGIENIEVAAGIPSLIQGYNNEDIARGIDEHMFRQPVGVVAAVTPFNFPFMIPLWYLPYAIACGNCFILKPSEKVPLSSQKLFDLIDQIGLPQGVVQLVNGGKETVDAILDHPDIRAISFVGSTPVAKYIYSRATANGKRAQCQGGAKNPVIILPDADMDMAAKILADSAFGCAGQRCLAASVAVTVGSARQEFVERIADIASSRKVGYGLDAGVEMGPVISQQSRERIEQLIGLGRQEGAELLVDGRGRAVAGYAAGSFVAPTILDHVAPGGELARTEIFGPVLSLMHSESVDEAIAMVNSNRYGNMACIFTSSGAAARKFRVEARAGNIGVNIAVPAPMAYFPFSGWNESFFGDLHAQGRHGVEFYTETKVVVERWPSEWSRTF